MKTKPFLILGLLILTATTGVAFSDGNNAGYNTSNTNTTTIGSDHNTGGATQGDASTMQQIQQGMQSLKDKYSTHSSSGTAQGQGNGSGSQSNSSSSSSSSNSSSNNSNTSTSP